MEDAKDEVNYTIGICFVIRKEYLVDLYILPNGEISSGVGSLPVGYRNCRRQLPTPNGKSRLESELDDGAILGRLRPKRRFARRFAGWLLLCFDFLSVNVLCGSDSSNQREYTFRSGSLRTNFFGDSRYFSQKRKKSLLIYRYYLLDERHL